MITGAQLKSLQGFNYEDVVLALTPDVEYVSYPNKDYFDVITTDGPMACMLDPLDVTFVVEAY